MRNLFGASTPFNTKAMNFMVASVTHVRDTTVTTVEDSFRGFEAILRFFFSISAGFFESGAAIFAEIPLGVFVAHGALIKE